MAKSQKSVKGKKVGKQPAAKKHAPPSRSTQSKKAPARPKAAVKSVKRVAAKVAKKSTAKPAARPAAKAAKPVKVVSKKPVPQPAKKAAKPAPAAPAKPVAQPAAKPVAKAAPAVAAKPALPAPAKKPAPRTPARPLTRPIPVGPPRAVVVVAAVPQSAWGPFREKLEKKRQDILDMYARDLRSGQEASDDNTDDLVDRANNAISRELMFALSDSERGLLLQVEEALQRIANGTYGRCVHCGQPIAAQRLEALPWAKYCIDCQELQEKGLLEDA